MTPTADAEVLVLGLVKSASEVATSPAGVVAPVVVTRACVQLMHWSVDVVNCGVFVPPALDCLEAGSAVANCVSSGKALSISDVESLFEKGVVFGEKVSRQTDYLVVAECVPGGTTTAAAVLKACGHDLEQLLPGSALQVDYDLRRRLISSGLAGTEYDAKQMYRNPLLAIAAVGDPMQPFAAGLVLSASARIPVILAGGGQMVAVYMLARALGKSVIGSGIGDWQRSCAAVITTKWVINDRRANLRQVSKILAVPLAYSAPNFNLLRHEGLRNYERGHVKEGVGAGAAMALSYLNGRYEEKQILSAIDDAFVEIMSAR
jgi:uncharacterized protein (TIGR00303 family)